MCFSQFVTNLAVTVKVVVMVASVKRLRIIITLTATFGWCVLYNFLWSSSCTVVVTAFDCRSPKQRVSRVAYSNGDRHIPPPQQLQQEQSHLTETLQQKTNQNIAVMNLFRDESFPCVTPKFATSVIGGLLLAMLISTMNTATAFAENMTINENSENPTVPISIVSCGTSTGSSSNCVSTASVKQVDLFMLPWTWPESISSDEVISRLKGVVASDQTLSVIDSTKVPSGENYFFRIHAARNICRDEIELFVNPNDRVITFRSQQIDGPDSVSDFGANRRRLEDIRKRLKVVTVLGGGGGENGDYYSNGESTEGLGGQLKAFWGFQSGGGFESILLDEDE